MAQTPLGNQSPVLVLGASGAIGHFLVPRLLDSGIPVMAVSRRRPEVSRTGLTWIEHDLASGPAPVEAAVLISAGPLALAAAQAKAMSRLGRVIAFSSASVRFKRESADPSEREAMARLLQAETELKELCAARGIGLTLFRPALIYGGPENANIGIIAALSGRYRWLPVAGNGRRHPVHAADLAGIAADALGRGETGEFDLGGGEILGYRELVRRVARAAGVEPRLVPVPAFLLKLALALAHGLGRLKAVRPAMIERQAMDLLVDDTEARRRLA